MKSELKLLQTSINNVVSIIEGLSTKQLNEIPQGFTNNLIWNVAHLTVTQKLLIYGLSGNELNLESDFVDNYRKGTKPESEVSESDCKVIITQFKNQFNGLQVDLDNGIFKTYKDYPTSYNFTITSLEDAICFNNLHYGLHVSTILKLKKAIL